jgi:uncharacterized membrane protein
MSKTTTLAVLSMALAFCVQDAVWISVMSPALYRPALGGLLRPEPDWLAALLFYAVYLSALAHFAALPALRQKRMGVAWQHALWLAMAAYGTYDLTNQASIVGWPWYVTLSDLAWSAWVSCSSATLGVWIGLRLRKP